MKAPRPIFPIAMAKSPPHFALGEGSTMPCVGITGQCSNITVKNCNFYFVADALSPARSPMKIPRQLRGRAG